MNLVAGYLILHSGRHSMWSHLTLRASGITLPCQFSNWLLPIVSEIFYSTPAQCFNKWRAMDSMIFLTWVERRLSEHKTYPCIEKNTSTFFQKCRLKNIGVYNPPCLRISLWCLAMMPIIQHNCCGRFLNLDYQEWGTISLLFSLFSWNGGDFSSIRSPIVCVFSRTRWNL